MSKRERLHPLALLVILFKSIKSILLVLLLLVLNLGDDSSSSLEIFAMTGFVIIFLVIPALVNYFTYSYQILEDKLIIYKGIFVKKETDIPYERIQTVQRKQWFFLQPFHVIELMIETASGGNQTEVSMPAVNEEVYERIEAQRNKERYATAESADSMRDESAGVAEKMAVAHTQPKYEISVGQILMLSVTESSILPFLLFGFFQDFSHQLIEKAGTQVENLMRQSLFLAVALTIFVLLIVFAVGIVKNLLRYYKFQVRREDGNLIIEKGLIQRSRLIVPIKRIQSVIVKQEILRRLFSLSGVELVLAASQGNEENSDKKFYLLPIVKDKELFSILGELIPEWELSQPQYKLADKPHWFYFSRCRFAGTAIFSLALGVFYQWWAGLLLAVFGVLFLIVPAFWSARVQGYQIVSSHLLCTQTVAGLSKVQNFIFKNKIQKFESSTSIWLWKRQISHGKMVLKSGDTADLVALRFLDQSSADRLKDWFVAH